MDWKRFKEFLQHLGVEMENEDIPGSLEVAHEPPTVILQQARDHAAFYRIEWFEERGLELLVLVPDDQTTLKFSFYLVQFREDHPFNDMLLQLLEYQGSPVFEQMDELPRWHLLHALGEVMKILFWAGLETSHFPTEITVQKIS